nr:MYB transcription factor 20 [Cladosporium cladosporioides]
MPFFIPPLFRKPFKIFAIDADTNQPIDPNVRKKTRVTYYELERGSNGSNRLVAHKTPSQVSKQAEGEAAKPAEEAKKDDGEDAPWTEEQDKTLIEMKKDTKNSNAMIGQEVGGRTKQEVAARWKVINPNKGENQDAGKKDNGGGGGDKGGNNQGQGKGGKKNKGGGNNQNNNQNNNNNNQQKKNDNNKQNNNNKKDDKNKNQNNHQNKSSDKPATKQPSNNGNAKNEARFTMNDWLTLQEDDIFSFGELQCLSELIARDMNQGWQRVAAKFFDLTGRRVHPDDVREKFESMAVAAEGKK